MTPYKIPSQSTWPSTAGLLVVLLEFGRPPMGWIITQSGTLSGIHEQLTCTHMVIHQEVLHRLQGWYKATVDRPPPPARATLRRVTAEREKLYSRVPPPPHSSLNVYMYHTKCMHYQGNYLSESKKQNNCERLKQKVVKYCPHPIPNRNKKKWYFTTLLPENLKLLYFFQLQLEWERSP